MHADEFPITLTTFPRIGRDGDFFTPKEFTLGGETTLAEIHGERLRSQFVPDQIANPHIRFPTLAANIRSRRGRKVEVNVPVFHDEKTPWPWSESNLPMLFVVAHDKVFNLIRLTVIRSAVSVGRH